MKKLKMKKIRDRRKSWRKERIQHLLKNGLKHLKVISILNLMRMDCQLILKLIKKKVKRINQMIKY
jgi:hypothetical protein